MDAINSLLLQSWGDTIRVFPAVPSRWKNVRFDHFSAQGAFLVSARRTDGVTECVSVQSQRGGNLRLLVDLPAGSFRVEAPSLHGLGQFRSAVGIELPQAGNMLQHACLGGVGPILIGLQALTIDPDGYSGLQ